ncbi:hypothetical protein EJB05_13183, partial [Eragrostis curvula]
MPDASPPTKATATRPPQCGRNSPSSPPPFSSQIGPPILFFPVLPIVHYRAMSQAPRGHQAASLRSADSGTTRPAHVPPAAADVIVGLRGFVAAGESKVPNRAQLKIDIIQITAKNGCFHDMLQRQE